MADVEIRTVDDPADLAGWARADAINFLEDPDRDSMPGHVRTLERLWQPGRFRGATADGRWVATLATHDRTLTVPDGAGGTRDLRADALTAVSVAATHRRRGVLFRMLTDSLAAAAERGDAVGILFAAEWGIYGRHGYAPATSGARYTLFPRRGGRPEPASPGRVRHVEREEVARLAPAVFDAARRRRPGQVDRPGGWWSRTLGIDGHEFTPDLHRSWLVHDGANGPDGLLAWRGTRDFDMYDRLGAIAVSNLSAANDEAYRDLWAYVAGIDAVEEVDLPNRPVDEPIRWLLPNGRALRCKEFGDALWLRLLDVPAALTARGYATPGEVVFEVRDDSAGGYAAGRYRLSATTDGTAHAERTTDPADVRLTQPALASAYLGGFSVRARAVAGDVEELRAGAVNRLDAMLHSPVAPWTQTTF